MKASLIIYIPVTPVHANKTGSLWVKIGTLFVFVSNIVTIELVIIAAISPTTSRSLAWVSVGLPRWVNFSGSILLVLDAVWGLLALLFNPNYTPMFQPMKKQFLLATRSPYAVVRHPRYAAEIWPNVILFLFTGIWLPLLGALGWVAIFYQARAEENLLGALAGEEYDRYRQNTGMFLPMFTGNIEMNLEMTETWLRWLAGLLAWTTLGVVLYGIWRGTRRQAGRSSGQASGWLRSSLFYLLTTALFPAWLSSCGDG